MLVTEKKPVEEILAKLGSDSSVFIVLCNGCPEACETGGTAALDELAAALEHAGKKVAGTAAIEFLCNKMLAGIRLRRQSGEIADADSVLVLSCGIGVQAVSKLVAKVVRPALNTVSVGGFQGLWPSDERCGQCGNCVLDATGGICPITFCAKSLLNGPCGGTNKGKCEVDSEKDCGWHLIFEKVTRIGAAGLLKDFMPARNYKKMNPAPPLRKTRLYDIER